ncbi:hypothetical protein KSF_096150 [Reticulibacter mediterranei]|uniref:Uncharacterized protein n=1 Tax=Reticulibacter mediterranei TaxID=2778369 RepID=A0A8J3IZD9_9CHLR|nr:hypothetical protein [Reticulibacter mediterranei]GHO99567.1 hypothetical protein KSF_096150 [Reticulibacter mediterranei]
MLFESKRTQIIKATLELIVRDVSQWIFPPTTYDVAVILRRHLEAQGIALDLDNACKVIQRRLRRS